MFISVTNDASEKQISFTEHAHEPSTVTVILDIMCINSIKWPSAMSTMVVSTIHVIAGLRSHKDTEQPGSEPHSA